MKYQTIIRNNETTICIFVDKFIPLTAFRLLKKRELVNKAIIIQRVFFLHKML